MLHSDIVRFIPPALLGLCSLLGCSGGDSEGSEGGGGSASSGTDETGGTTSTAGGGQDGAAGAGSEPTLGVRFVGRVETSEPENVRFAWSGTGVVARFSGTEVAVRLGGGQQYTVVIDGKVGDKLVSTGVAQTLATGLDAGEHVVELYRRTEASQGVSVF